MRHIRFRFAPAKALAAIHWMIKQAPGIDLHTILKACYFADKQHINDHDRPIFGAVYRAMKFGPVPIEIYQMTKCEPLWLAELNLDRFPWELDGYRLKLISNEEPDLSALSESDLDALTSGLEKSRAMTFTSRTAATHGSDWQGADLGVMAYEDMIEDGPQKSDRVAILRETSRFMKL